MRHGDDALYADNLLVREVHDIFREMCIRDRLHTIRRLIMVYPVQKADQYAKTCNTKGIMFMAVWWPQIFKLFLFGIPMFFGLYFGAEAIGNLMNSLPVWITNALSATGKMLPALGFAMTVNAVSYTHLDVYKRQLLY